MTENSSDTRKAHWIDNHEWEPDREPGSLAILVEHSHNLKGWLRPVLQDEPPRTNQSHQPRLFGWCGTYNDEHIQADGVWEIVKYTQTSHRVYIRPVREPERVNAYLEGIGYPELALEV